MSVVMNMTQKLETLKTVLHQVLLGKTFLLIGYAHYAESEKTNSVQHDNNNKVKDNILHFLY